MASFSSSTFSTSRYLAARPRYPSWLYKEILQRHSAASTQPSWNSALDLGCGPGISTLPLLPHFKNVTGVDPSSKMIQTASTLDLKSEKENLYLQLSKDSSPKLGSLDFKTSSAESLSFGDNSMDLIVAGQAAHWFNYKPFWKEIDRILKPKGTIALFGYAEIFLPKYPTTREMISNYCHGKDSLGPYWSQPGRSIVEKGLKGVPFPWEVDGSIRDRWNVDSSTRQMFSLRGLPRGSFLKEWPTSAYLEGGEEKEMSKAFNQQTLLEYFRTFSALHEYQNQHPKDLKLVEEGKGQDLATKFSNEIWGEVKKVEGKAVKEIEGKWPLALLICQKK